MFTYLCMCNAHVCEGHGSLQSLNLELICLAGLAGQRVPAPRAGMPGVQAFLTFTWVLETWRQAFMFTGQAFYWLRVISPPPAPPPPRPHSFWNNNVGALIIKLLIHLNQPSLPDSSMQGILVFVFNYYTYVFMSVQAHKSSDQRTCRSWFSLPTMCQVISQPWQQAPSPEPSTILYTSFQYVVNEVGHGNSPL
jgi:hypothetical protein